MLLLHRLRASYFVWCSSFLSVGTEGTEHNALRSNFGTFCFIFIDQTPIMARKRCHSLGDNTLLLKTADGAAHSGGSGGSCLPSTSSNSLQQIE
jgi:hypothetical protein